MTSRLRRTDAWFVLAAALVSVQCSKDNLPSVPDPSPTHPNVVVDAGPDLSVMAGDSLRLTFRFSQPDGATLWTFAIRWGDGAVDSGVANRDVPQTVPHVFADAGYYRSDVTVKDGAGNSGAGHVAISVARPPDPEVFVGAGDIGQCNLPFAEQTAELLDGIPGTVFTIGDNAYPDGSSADFAGCYDVTWGRHRNRTRPAIGNHEYQTPGAAGYFGYFGAAAGDPGKGYYSFDLGAWHVVVLNSNLGKIDAGEQERWLAGDLAAHPALCTIAYAHHPRFSSGLMERQEAGMQRLWQVLYDGGVDVVLAGHDHIYERFDPQTPDGHADGTRGITEFVVGTGGAAADGVGSPAANSVVRSSAHGVLKLLLDRRSYRWEFVPVPGSSFMDSGSRACH